MSNTLVALHVLVIMIMLFSMAKIAIDRLHHVEHFDGTRPTVPIYIVSLTDRRPERTQLILSRIQSSPLYTIANVGAVDGTLRIDITGQEQFQDGVVHTRGEVGCILSHLENWGRLSVSEYPYGLILEDDADIHLPEMWPEYIEKPLLHAPNDWEIIWLGNIANYTPEAHVPVNSYISRMHGVLHGTQAYLITRQCAERLYKKYKHLLSWSTLEQFTGAKIMPLDDLLSKEPNIVRYMSKTNIPQRLDVRSDTTPTLNT